MNAHEQWLRTQGLGSLLDNAPSFMQTCDCDENNMDEVCPSCLFRKDCEEYREPLTKALERYTEIGEV